MLYPFKTSNMKQNILGAILAGNIILLPVLSFLNYKLRLYFQFYNFEKVLIIIFSVSTLLSGVYLIFSKSRDESATEKFTFNGIKARQILGFVLVVVSTWYLLSFSNYGTPFVFWYLSCFVIGAILLTMKNQHLIFFRN